MRMLSNGSKALVQIPVFALLLGGCAVEFGGDGSESPTLFPNYPTAQPTEEPTDTPEPTPTLTPTLEPTPEPDPTPQNFYFEATRLGEFYLLGEALYTVDRSTDGAETVEGWTRLDYEELTGIPFTAMTVTQASLDADGRLVLASIQQEVTMGGESFDRSYEVDAELGVMTVNRGGHTVEWALDMGELGPLAPWTWESDPHFRYSVPDVGMAYIAQRAANVPRDNPSLLIADFFNSDESFNDVGGCFTLSERICTDGTTDEFITSIGLTDVDGSLDRIRLPVADRERPSVEAGGSAVGFASCSLEQFSVQEDRISRGGLPTLAVEYVLPEGDGPFPIVTFMADQGGSDRDWSTNGGPVARCLALDFLSRGFAVSRWDERGFGESGGGEEDTSFEDRTGDLLDVYNHIAEQSFVIPSQIFAVGHGEGALHVAELLDGRANFSAMVAVASFSGLGETFWTNRSERYLDQFVLSGDFSANYLSVQSQALDDIQNQSYLNSTYSGLSLIYWEQFLPYDAAATWATVDIPLFIVQGDSDWEVSPDEADLIETLVVGAGNSQVTKTVYEGLGHHLSKVESGPLLGGEYYLPYVWDAAVVEDISTWLGEQVP